VCMCVACVHARVAVLLISRESECVCWWGVL